MTANDDEAMRNEAMDAGCIAYLRKPFARSGPAGCYWESCGLTGGAQQEHAGHHVQVEVKLRRTQCEQMRACRSMGRNTSGYLLAFRERQRQPRTTPPAGRIAPCGATRK